jgi:glucosamine--fructose-6-phosphate aminotransferase (isomerizing)
MTRHGSIMESEIAQTPEIFEKILASHPINDQISTLISDRKISSILILARGTSDNAAHFLKYLIETQLGLPCGLCSPSSVSIYNSTLHYSDTLVVAISQSGKSTDLVQFAQAAKTSGATLVSLTNDDASPLAQASDFHISLQAGPEIAVAATKSYSAQLLLSYLLVMSWAKATPKTDELSSRAQELFGHSADIAEIAKTIDLGSEIVILGRGFAYPNAKEAALKIQETCKVNVQGMSTADYLHGPISALNAQSQVIIMTPYLLPQQSVQEAVDRIRAVTKKIYWIGNGAEPLPGERVIPGSICADEITSSIVDSMALQLLALHLSVINGFNPDAPEGLSKVTLTI